jgi:hypothetical protein
MKPLQHVFYELSDIYRHQRIQRQNEEPKINISHKRLVAMLEKPIIREPTKSNAEARSPARSKVDLAGHAARRLS